MIVTFLLNIFYLFVLGLIQLLPTGNLPQAMTDAIAYFMGVVNSFSYVIPVGTLLQALAIVLAFDAAMLLWRFINWIIRKIPGMQ